MVTEHDEIEVKYDVDPGAELPALGALLRGSGVDVDGLSEGDRGDHVLEAVYFDTTGLALADAGVTLRRRTGGEDAGWHLKTPGTDGARREHQVPLGRAVRTVPVALRRLVEHLTDGAPMVPVARVDTRRHVRPVVDASGRRLAELADDLVEARRLLAGDGETDQVQTWREVELELVDGDRALFDALDAGLQVAGLRVSASSSKLGRVLGRTPEPAPAPELPPAPALAPVHEVPAPHVVPAPEPGAAPEPTPRPAPAPGLPPAPALAPVHEVPAPAASAGARRLPKSTLPKRKALGERSAAGDVLLVHLREQVEQVLRQDPAVRADEPDSVHRMRVATRRLRSALRTFAPLLSAPTGPLRSELRWLAAELGEARDAEVLRDRLVPAVAALDAPSPSGDAAAGAGADGVARQVEEQLGTAYREAHDHVLAQLDSERYQQLLDTLQDLVVDPQLTERAGRRAGKVLPRRVERTYRTLDDLVEEAGRTPAGHEHDELLHEARKAAKQVRYAAEAVSAVFGEDAERFAAAVTQVQDVLGEHQDSVVTRERLHALAQGAPSEVAFAYGRLHALEEVRTAAGEADFDDVWKALQAKRLHRWLH